MSFSEYNGNKIKVSQTVGRIFKNAQENFPKIQAPQAIGALMKTITPSGSSNCEHERLNKSNSPSNQSSSKFGFQKFRLRTGLDKKKKKNHHRAELLENQDVGDPDDSADETEFQNHYPPMSNASLIGPPTSSSSPTMQKQKRWPF